MLCSYCDTLFVSLVDLDLVAAAFPLFFLMIWVWNELIGIYSR